MSHLTKEQCLVFVDTIIQQLGVDLVTDADIYMSGRIRRGWKKILVASLGLILDYIIIVVKSNISLDSDFNNVVGTEVRGIGK